MNTLRQRMLEDMQIRNLSPTTRKRYLDKELWQVEQLFIDIKSIMRTKSVFHQRDETIRGHVFCSFLALVLRKELNRRLEAAGLNFEWADIKQDLKALQETSSAYAYT